jgi:hypothetical protein
MATRRKTQAVATASGRPKAPKTPDAAAAREQLRLLAEARTLEARLAELLADLDTLEAAITAMRRRYPDVQLGPGGHAMSVQTIGWVMDMETSTRRLHITLEQAGVVGVWMEGSGQQPGLVQLEAEDVVYLQNLLRQALERMAAAKDA